MIKNIWYVLPALGLLIFAGVYMYVEIFNNTSRDIDLVSSTPPPLTTMAWVYPYEPSCNAEKEYTDGRFVTVLKAEYFTLEGGSLGLLSEDNTVCNGFSTTTISKLKSNSAEQYVTVSSANVNDMQAFFANEMNDGIDTLTNFAVTHDLAGVEVNFEDFANWTPALYRQYKTFVTLLGNTLHQNGKKLMLDGPAVTSASEESDWYLWRYADFVSLPVDYMVVMAYDYQYDYGAGTPVAPLRWIEQVITYVSSQYPKEKLTIGLPSYGYGGAADSYEISLYTQAQMASLPGYSSAVRDNNSGEMTWQQNGTIYFYQDQTSLDQKLAVVLENNIHSVSVWHLGGNPWFSN
jgi:spore germination protein YaaH